MKFFVVSDIHGYFDEFKKALDEAGYDKNNTEHFIISCGDNWDRGSQPIEVMQFFNLHDRVILVKGNHESLLEECCERGYADGHDYLNGTFDTICEFGGEGRLFDECCTRTFARTGFFLDKMVNYFETKNYIFVHGWIPVKCNDDLPSYYTRKRDFEFNPDWRLANKEEWEQARWLNGIKMARQGFIEPNKTIICGHWHCSYGHYLKALEKAIVENTEIEVEEFGPTAIWEPFEAEGIIAIDACTAHTGKVNILVIEDEFLDE